MESVEGYEHQGISRQEFGSKYDMAYYTYEDGTLTVVLPNDLKLSKADNLRIVLGGSQISSISGNQVVTAKSAKVSVSEGYTIVGNLTVTGDVTITGNCNIEGELTVKGRITSDTDVFSRNISLGSHYHDGVHGNTSKPR